MKHSPKIIDLSLRSCDEVAARVVKKLAEFCNDGEAVVVEPTVGGLLVRSLDVPGKAMFVPVRKSCIKHVLKMLREGSVVAEVCR